MPDKPPLKTPARIKRLAYLLDSAIPLPGGRSIGLEAIVGLVPGVGDIIGAIASCYIVAEGVRMGAPKWVVARMIGNVLLESTVGVVPVVGDLFDMVYKSNMRNIGMLMELENQPVAISESHHPNKPLATSRNNRVVVNEKKNNRMVLWVCLGIAMLFLIAIIWLTLKALVFIATAIF